MKDLNNTKNPTGPQIPQWRQALYAPATAHTIESESKISTSDVLLYIAFLSRAPKHARKAAATTATKTQKRKTK